MIQGVMCKFTGLTSSKMSRQAELEDLQLAPTSGIYPSVEGYNRPRHDTFHDFSTGNPSVI